MNAWTFEGYWNAVVGDGLTPEAAVGEFELEGATAFELGEWLDKAEHDASLAGEGEQTRDEILAAWADGEFQKRAVGLLSKVAPKCAACHANPVTDADCCTTCGAGPICKTCWVQAGMKCGEACRAAERGGWEMVQP